MKILIAPDSFTGALRASQVAATLKKGWLAAAPEDDVACFPLSDGGEGLIDVLGKDFYSCQVVDPLMRQVIARYASIGDWAILESAEADELELLKKTELNPLKTTSYGVGMLIADALNKGFRKLIIGIGGTATVDCGVGMLQALGCRFQCGEKLLNNGAAGADLANVTKIDKKFMMPELMDSKIVIAADVKNLLTGERGAARVFGPQKGASREMVEVLEKNLSHFAEVVNGKQEKPGDGAAGGIGFALRNFCGAESESGAQLVMKYSGFIEALTGADLVITGEGCSDDQSMEGKICVAAADAARRFNVPTVLLSGAISGDWHPLKEKFAGCFSIASGPCNLTTAIDSTADNLERMAQNIAGIIHAVK